MAHEREHRYSFSDTEEENLSNDLLDLKKVVSQIVDNYCSEFINQPAVIPEVKEYEKTLQSEDMAKVTAISFNLHNLNLRKFSPSPVMNFSSHSNSPAHNFFSDFYNGSDRANSSDLNDNTNAYLPIATDFAGIVPELRNSAEEELSDAHHDSELADAPSSSSSEGSKEETIQEQTDRKSSSVIEECPPQQTRLSLKKQYMAEKVEEVLIEIGPENFIILVTDNASAMVKARNIMHEKYKHISVYGCVAHTLNLLIEDIYKMRYVDDNKLALKSQMIKGLIKE
ncbi:unnamed protein product [Psylliodes chrysocephalus]|uniref:DUF659 domain-containing protein n=1 Tax=Psylliodes chrysocephalus TaxID=3402493 RepID=A0A9P0GGM9_9CUCU|nr:unnamed protein product [Psylliodes chrysocephala]